jgi:hypothetical protein
MKQKESCMRLRCLIDEAKRLKGRDLSRRYAAGCDVGVLGQIAGDTADQSIAAQEAFAEKAAALEYGHGSGVGFEHGCLDAHDGRARVRFKSEANTPSSGNELYLGLFDLDVQTRIQLQNEARFWLKVHQIHERTQGILEPAGHDAHVVVVHVENARDLFPIQKRLKNVQRSLLDFDIKKTSAPGRTHPRRFKSHSKRTEPRVQDFGCRRGTLSNSFEVTFFLKPASCQHLVLLDRLRHSSGDAGCCL